MLFLKVSLQGDEGKLLLSLAGERTHALRCLTEEKLLKTFRISIYHDTGEGAKKRYGKIPYLFPFLFFGTPP